MRKMHTRLFREVKDFRFEKLWVVFVFLPYRCLVSWLTEKMHRLRL